MIEINKEISGGFKPGELMVIGYDPSVRRDTSPTIYYKYRTKEKKKPIHPKGNRQRNKKGHNRTQKKAAKLYMKHLVAFLNSVRKEEIEYVNSIAEKFSMQCEVTNNFIQG